MKADDVHVVRLPNYIQQLQDTPALTDMLGADPACLTGAVKFFKPFMPEAIYQLFQCKSFSLQRQLPVPNRRYIGAVMVTIEPDHLRRAERDEFDSNEEITH